MIRRSRRRRTSEFPHPAIRGAADFVVLGAPASPYRPGTIHDTLYRMGYIYARDSRDNPSVIKFTALMDFADRALQALGHPIPSRKPERQRPKTQGITQ